MAQDKIYNTADDIAQAIVHENNLPKTQSVCPNCGYCPHCHRGGSYTVPGYPAPYYPTYPQITWTSGTGTGDYWQSRGNF